MSELELDMPTLWPKECVERIRALRAERDAMIDAQQLTDERLERVEDQVAGLEELARLQREGRERVERQLEEARAEVERLRTALHASWQLAVEIDMARARSQPLEPALSALLGSLFESAALTEPGES